MDEFFKAAYRGNLNILKECKDINIIDENGQTLLIKCILGFNEQIKNEIKKIPNIYGISGRREILRVFSNSHYNCIKYLINSNIDVNIKDNNNNSAIFLIDTSLIRRIRNVKIYKPFFNNSNLDLNVQDNNGNTILFDCAYSSISDTMTIYNTKFTSNCEEYNINLQNNQGYTLIFHNINRGYYVFNLIKYYFNVIDYSLTDKINNYTLLHFLVLKNLTNIISYLLF